MFRFLDGQEMTSFMRQGTLFGIGKGHHRLLFESVDTISSKIHFKMIIPFTRMAHRRYRRCTATKFKTVSCFCYMPKV